MKQPRTTLMIEGSTLNSCLMMNSWGLKSEFEINSSHTLEHNKTVVIQNTLDVKYNTVFYRGILCST